MIKRTLLASFLVAPVLSAQTDEITFNPLMPRPQTPASSNYDSVPASASSAKLPGSQTSSTLRQELQGRRNQYDSAVKGIGRRGNYDLLPIRQQTPPGYSSPSSRFGTGSTSQSTPRGSTGTSTQTPTNSASRSTGSSSSQLPTIRFPTVSSVASSTGSDMAETKVASSRSPRGSSRISAGNGTAIERDIKNLQSRINQRRSYTSEQSIDRRINRIEQRHQQQVTERIKLLRMGGKLERLAINSSGQLANPKTGALAGSADLPKADQRDLAKERDRAIKQVRNGEKQAKKFIKKLEQKQNTLMKKQAKQLKNQKPTGRK